MKTEQTLMNVLCVMCAVLVLSALVVLVSTQIAPADAVHATVQSAPHALPHTG